MGRQNVGLISSLTGQLKVCDVAPVAPLSPAHHRDYIEFNDHELLQYERSKLLMEAATHLARYEGSDGGGSGACSP